MNEHKTIKAVAVTGTNGKTSTVELTRKLLLFTGNNPASLGTLGLKVKGVQDYEPIIIGAESLSELADELTASYNIDTLIYEAFSASISGKLYDKLPPDIAVLTYISEDHMDYHGSIENYVNAKLHLFRELLVKNGTAIFNSGDERASLIESICEERNLNKFSFGFERNADLRLNNVKTKKGKSFVELIYQFNLHQVVVPFIGEIFLLNWLAALSICIQFNIDLDKLLNNSQNLTLPPGRLEYLGSYNGANIYLDYAHTACALKAILCTLRQQLNTKLVVVFGCGGGRDHSKRSQMGIIAHQYADEIYITDDNPRNESPSKIRKQILEHCPNAKEIGDRKIAIQQAISNLRPVDTLVIAGKGHEDYQEVNGMNKYFSDKKTVIEYLQIISQGI